MISDLNSEKRNYVAAWADYKSDKIVVIERDASGKRHRKRYNPPYYFYVPDEEEGTETSIFGDKLTRAEFGTREEYTAAKEQFQVKFESDISPLRRILMDIYYGRPTPIVHYAFLDIEVDYSQALGFAGPQNPYAPINALSIYQSWTGKYLSYVVPPKGWSGSVDDLYSEIDKLISEGKLRKSIIPEIIICRDETDILNKLVEAVEDADILSGWNSEFYDIPYICLRIKHLLGCGSLEIQPLQKENCGDGKRCKKCELALAKLDHQGCSGPKLEWKRKFNVIKGQPKDIGGKELDPLFVFTGKSHLDYMALFKKFTFEGRTSYSLGNILSEEVDVGKLEYDGTLEHLYKNNFPLFTAYNFRDVDGLVQLDQKFKFIALVNQMAHENTVEFKHMLGTVAYVETAIANHAHYVLNKRVHDKNIIEHDKVEGAIVMTPKIGLHPYVGSVDIKSQYPNTIRSLNISPEMIRGQFEANEQAWQDIRDGKEVQHTLILESGGIESHTAEEWRWELLQRQWAISAYGTVFDQSQGPGIVAQVVGFWYEERKRLQKEKKKFDKLAKDETDPAKKKEYEKQAEHFDLLQLTKKISMNSLYGALLNVAFRFGDERMGASVTATGRAITTHVVETLSDILTGSRTGFNVKRFINKKSGKREVTYEPISDAIIYGDTDSCYFKTYADNKADAVETADLAATQLNASFKPFMTTAFSCQPDFAIFIEAGREIVAVRGLFQAKKKYVLKIVDLEGFPPKPDKEIKSQGSEIKKADTPKIIQKFLKKTVDMILDGSDYDSICTFVNQQRKEILKTKINVFQIGVTKQVNKLDKFLAEYNNPGTVRSESGRKLSVPGHVRAACNYNFLLNTFDKGSKDIRSGDKATVYYLRPNQFNFDSIAFPAENSKFPKWFEENFKVDIKRTEDKMFDNKLKGIFKALGKDVPSPQSVLTNSILDFG